jgi:hypothetical protein
MDDAPRSSIAKTYRAEKNITRTKAQIALAPDDARSGRKMTGDRQGRADRQAGL